MSEKVTIKIVIGQASILHSFHVLKGRHNIILGMDFLQAHDAVVDFGSGKMHLGISEIKLGHPAVRSCLARATRSMAIEANSITQMPVKCSKKYCKDMLFLEPAIYNSYSEITVMPTVAFAHGTETTWCVINRSNIAITLPAQYVVARGSVITEAEVSAVASGESEEKVQPQVCSLNQSGENISFNVDNSNLSIEDRSVLESFLRDNRQVFANSTAELGRSSTMQHTIDTQGSKPVAQRFYRASPEKRAEIDRQVEEFLELGLVEPSTSEWRSPVVLVRKESRQ